MTDSFRARRRNHQVSVKPGQHQVGVDIGKTHHWVCALDADGKKLLSVKVANDEAEIVE
jgi:hypothetical protein